MCIGVPGKIIAVGSSPLVPATVEIGGITREINLSLVSDDEPDKLIGQWVLVHVGFAMSVLTPGEADEMLSALNQMEGIATPR